MIRVMLDTDQLDKLTGHVPLLATYTDLVTDLAPLQAKFPHSEIILIDRHGEDHTGLASVLDVENGLHSAADIPAWYDRQHAKGVRYLTVYCDRSHMSEVTAALGQRPAYRWVATLDGTAHLPGYTPLHRPTLMQVLGESQLGYHADLSLAFDDDWHPQPLATLPAGLIEQAKRVADDAETVHTLAMALEATLRHIA